MSTVYGKNINELSVVSTMIDNDLMVIENTNGTHSIKVRDIKKFLTTNGPIGLTGPQGTQGIQGPIGPRGYTPDIGPNGNWWANGIDLKVPARGDQGPKGETGPKGEKGDAGLQGPQGDPGDQGPKGDDGPRGLKGETGDTGPQGPQGLPGQRGLQGEMGPQGPVGPQGPIGPKGDTGLTGPKGNPGDVGLKGDPGAPGAKGEPGEKGDPGVPGPKGDDGHSFTIKGRLADIASLPANPSISDAYVIGTNVHMWNGTEWVDLGSIQGAKGDPGTNGTNGQDGAQGPPGISPHIDSTSGNWFIGTADQGVKAQGPKGEPGDQGPPGTPALPADLSRFVTTNGGGDITGKVKLHDVDLVGVMSSSKLPTTRQQIFTPDLNNNPYVYFSNVELSSVFETKDYVYIKSPGATWPGYKIYHEGLKPTPADIGAYNIAQIDTKMSSHTHDNTTITGIDAAKITTGIIDIARLPKGAVHEFKPVADKAARLALTANDVQVGDTVEQLDTKALYIVIDVTKLNVEEGYKEYTAGAATSVPWSGVTARPNNLTGYGIMDAATSSQMTDANTKISSINTAIGEVADLRTTSHTLVPAINQVFDSAKSNTDTIGTMANLRTKVKDTVVNSINEVFDTLNAVKLKALTKAEYDALATKDATTLYIITG